MEIKETGTTDSVETEFNPITQNKDFGVDLFNTYHKTVYNFAYKMTGNKEDAEDILQEVFSASRILSGDRGYSDDNLTGGATNTS